MSAAEDQLPGPAESVDKQLERIVASCRELRASIDLLDAERRSVRAILRRIVVEHRRGWVTNEAIERAASILGDRT